MWLFIDADSNPATGWEGYDFVVNRTTSARRPRLARAERRAAIAGAGRVDVPYRVAGNEMELAIPRAALGLPQATGSSISSGPTTSSKRGEASDFSLHGDVAPNERFNFRFGVR